MRRRAASVSSDIRVLGLADLPRILELEPQLFGNEAWSEGSYRDELTGPDRVYLGVDVDGVLAAYGGVWCGREAEILTVGTDPAYRRRGLARRLMEALLAAARSRGAREVFLEVRAGDEGAQALYRGLGFTRVGLRRNYYQPSGEDALVMRLRLTDRDTGRMSAT